MGSFHYTRLVNMTRLLFYSTTADKIVPSDYSRRRSPLALLTADARFRLGAANRDPHISLRSKPSDRTYPTQVAWSQVENDIASLRYYIFRNII